LSKLADCEGCSPLVTTIFLFGALAVLAFWVFLFPAIPDPLDAGQIAMPFQLLAAIFDRLFQIGRCSDSGREFAPRSPGVPPRSFRLSVFFTDWLITLNWSGSTVTTRATCGATAS